MNSILGTFRLEEENDAICGLTLCPDGVPELEPLPRKVCETPLLQEAEEQLNEYLGHRFEALCAEWLVEQAKQGKLPIPATAVSSWWGTNPDKRAQDDIDVLAADRVSKRLVIGECKYRGSFDESAEINDLESKRGLVKGFTASHFILFCKHDVSAATKKKLAAREDWQIVTLKDMYID